MILAPFSSCCCCSCYTVRLTRASRIGNHHGSEGRKNRKILPRKCLTELRKRCRELMRDLSVAKYGRDGRARPFGGLNVILAGDLYQLPPPKGTFLGDIPWDLVAGRKATKRATALHGQTLLWGGPDAGMQGVTELLRCERTADAWLTEVQTELRHGQLSDNNHAFLHGGPTTVPGSWIAGRVTCKSQQCAALGTGVVPPHIIQQQECSVCAEDRASRALWWMPSQTRDAKKH